MISTVFSVTVEQLPDGHREQPVSGMFGGLGSLIVLTELVLAIPVLVIVIGIIIMDPLGGLAGVFLFGLVCSRVVHHWRRTSRKDSAYQRTHRGR
jgi:hypothetical protein